MNAVPNPLLFSAGLLGFFGVALGAFGAHGLKATLEAHSSLETWKTAVLYQLVHAVALLAIAMWRDVPPKVPARIAASWLMGTLFFCGSLYWLALGGPKFLGPITPIGGVSYLVGWALLIWHAWKR